MRICTLFIVASFFLIGCSAGSNNELNAPEKGDFQANWILTGYTLYDGTMKSVPEAIKRQGGVGIFITSTDNMGVQSGLCDFYQISYILDNDVLTTSDPVDPEGSCTGYFGDVDNAERSELMRRTFRNSQTLTVISDNVLTVTTMQNEQLKLERTEP